MKHKKKRVMNRKTRMQLLKLKGKKMVIAEVNNRKVYGEIERVGTDHVVVKMNHRGKVVRTKVFPFGGFGGFGGAFGSLLPLLFFPFFF